MPLFQNKVLSGDQFTGATDEDGLFSFPTGGDRIQIRVNSLSFHTSVACTFNINLVRPTDGENMTLLYTGSMKDLFMTNIILPVESGHAWNLVATTSGMTEDGFLNIDYDFIQTEG